MTDVGIDNDQYYGRPSASNGRIVFIGGEQLAVEYARGPLVVVPKPEMAGLFTELSLSGWGDTIVHLADWMAVHLGMVVQPRDGDLSSRVHEAGVPA